jgi:hypothetical protein
LGDELGDGRVPQPGEEGVEPGLVAGWAVLADPDRGGQPPPALDWEHRGAGLGLRGGQHKQPGAAEPRPVGVVEPAGVADPGVDGLLVGRRQPELLKPSR